MMQRGWTLVGGLVLVGAFTGLAGCSSADNQEDAGTGGSSGTGSSTGGTGTATGGTGTATGGTGTATGGTGTDTGGTGSSTGGMTGTNSDPECKGISTGAACPIQGKSCPNLVCGLADSGTRSCDCATNWTCTSCDYTNSWIKDKPADIQTCPAEAADGVDCLNVMQVCGPVGTEYCACYEDAKDGLVWDCDKAPSSWM
jgi:hypothetical protein